MGRCTRRSESGPPGREISTARITSGIISLIVTPTPLPAGKLIDLGLVRVNAADMDEDDFFSSRPQDPLSLLVKQDLGPLSADELEARIDMLRKEITRVEQHMADVARHRNAADELFKR